MPSTEELENFARKDIWVHLDELVRAGTIVVDRPAGSRHPRVPEYLYPLEGTDGGSTPGFGV